MTDFMTVPRPLLIPRKFISPLVRHLQLPLSSLGKLFMETQTDLADNTTILQWCQALSEQKICDWVAVIAAPILLADIRIYYHQTSQLRTWALTGGIEDDAPWLFLAPVNDGQDYKIQPVAQRDLVVNSLFAYLQSGASVWEYDVSFHCTVTEFSVLMTLADVYSRMHYVSLILHQPVPTSVSSEDLLQAYDNVTNYTDQRYLFWSIIHLLPEPTRHIDRKIVLDIIDKLIKRGLIQRDDDQFAWTEAGLFFVSSLHERLCTLAIDLAGGTVTGAIGTQGALFIRTDHLLWFFDIDPSPDGLVTVASISLETAYKLLDEVFTPVGKPPLESSVRFVEQKTMSASPGTPPPPPPVPQTIWYYLANGKQFGPLTENDLLYELEQGHLPLNSLVWNPSLPSWLPANKVESLVAHLPAPGICPSCGTKANSGAKFCSRCGTKLT